MYSRNVSARHEPKAQELIDQYFAWYDGHIGDAELRNWVIARDRQLALELDSSWLNVLILHLLAGQFPEARFVLTIRDCYSWLNSEFKRVLHAPSRIPQRIKIRNHIYGHPSLVHQPEEKILKDVGLHTIDGYLSRWAAHNEKVLAMIPSERLLVVRTPQIRQRAYEITDFAGLPRHTVRLERTHRYQNPIQRNIILELDRNFLERKVEQHCRPLMDRFFPEIRSLDDATL